MSKSLVDKMVQCEKLIALASSNNRYESNSASRKACEIIRNEKLHLIPQDMWIHIVNRVLGKEFQGMSLTPLDVYRAFVAEEERRDENKKKEIARKGFKVMSVRTYTTAEAAYNAMRDHERAGYQKHPTQPGNGHQMRLYRGDSEVIIEYARQDGTSPLGSNEKKDVVPPPAETKRGVDEGDDSASKADSGASGESGEEYNRHDS